MRLRRQLPDQLVGKAHADFHGVHVRPGTSVFVVVNPGRGRNAAPAGGERRAGNDHEVDLPTGRTSAPRVPARRCRKPPDAASAGRIRRIASHPLRRAEPRCVSRRSTAPASPPCPARREASRKHPPSGPRRKPPAARPGRISGARLRRAPQRPFRGSAGASRRAVLFWS